MSARYFKAVRPDGRSFNDPTFTWATEPGGVTTHPAFDRDGGASGYLSVATVATDCTGFQWPCRLLVVEPYKCRVFTPNADSLPNKRAGRAFRTVGERPAHEVFGPQGEQVVALIERAGRLTRDEAKSLCAAWDAAGDAAWDAAWVAAWDAAWDAAGDAAWVAAWDAARVAAWDAAGDAAWDAARVAGALVVRDLITTDHYDLLTGPWRSTIGPIHPDDPDWGQA